MGISLAYYNTCSLAFDTEPVIASVDDDNITFLDFSVSRKELKKIKKVTKNHGENRKYDLNEISQNYRMKSLDDMDKF